MITMQAGVERLLRAGFMCALFAGLFGTGHWRLHTTRRAHIIVLRLLGCQVPAVRNYARTAVCRS
jgi:hypothetical protein